MTLLVEEAILPCSVVNLRVGLLRDRLAGLGSEFCSFFSDRLLAWPDTFWS